MSKRTETVSTWPSMLEWEATLPAREPDRLIAHTKLYREHNLRLMAVHAADAVTGKFPKGAEDLGAAARAELAEILAKLRRRCAR
jgi:hypothetical protein